MKKTRMEDCSLSCVVYCLSLIHAEMSLVLCKYSISSANGFIAAWRWWMVISGLHLTVQRPYVRTLNHEYEPTDVVLFTAHIADVLQHFSLRPREEKPQSLLSVNNIF